MWKIEMCEIAGITYEQGEKNIVAFNRKAKSKTGTTRATTRNMEVPNNLSDYFGGDWEYVPTNIVENMDRIDGVSNLLVDDVIEPVDRIEGELKYVAQDVMIMKNEMIQLKDQVIRMSEMMTGMYNVLCRMAPPEIDQDYDRDDITSVVSAPTELAGHDSLPRRVSPERQRLIDRLKAERQTSSSSSGKEDTLTTKSAPDEFIQKERFDPNHWKIISSFLIEYCANCDKDTALIEGLCKVHEVDYSPWCGKCFETNRGSIKVCGSGVEGYGCGAVLSLFQGEIDKVEDSDVWLCSGCNEDYEPLDNEDQ